VALIGARNPARSGVARTVMVGVALVTVTVMPGPPHAWAMDGSLLASPL
jgi:hypothetical protein